MQTEQKILQLLSDGLFHSGEEIGEALNVTRSAVWKVLKQVEAKYHLPIHAVKGKGYRLEYPCELLAKDQVVAQLDEGAQSKLDDVIVFSTLDSTHLYAMKALKSSETQNIAILSEFQSDGRGRRGRQWVSPFASNIYLSMTWRFNRDPMNLAGLSLVVALAVVKALEEFGVEGLKIKWPNDIYFHNKKLAGVLLDVVGEVYGSSRAVVSVGLNVRMSGDSVKEIEQPWTDLEKITGQLPSRNRIVAMILNSLSTTLGEFDVKGLDGFLNTWKQYDLATGKRIKIIQDDRVLLGVSKGISSRGELLIETDSGVQTIHAGDVSLRFE